METNDAEEYSSEYSGTKISMEEASCGLRLVRAWLEDFDGNMFQCVRLEGSIEKNFHLYLRNEIR